LRAQIKSDVLAVENKSRKYRK